MLSPQITFHQMEVIINHSFQKKKEKKKNQPLISLFSSQSRVRIPHDCRREGGLGCRALTSTLGFCNFEGSCELAMETELQVSLCYFYYFNFWDFVWWSDLSGSPAWSPNSTGLSNPHHTLLASLVRKSVTHMALLFRRLKIKIIFIKWKTI